jgi:hypothetical protein
MKKLSVLCVTALLCSASLQADCPETTNASPTFPAPIVWWYEYAFVAYSFRVGYPPGGVGGCCINFYWDPNDIGNAVYDTTVSFNSWNFVNTGNGDTSWVQWYQDPAQPPAVTYPAQTFYAEGILYPGSYGLDPGVAGQTARGRYAGTNVEAIATTTYYYGGWNANCPCSPLQLQAPNYDLFITKLAAHEMGHTMGLNDNYSYSGGAVMDPEGNTNDYYNQIAAAPTSCDTNGVMNVINTP